MLALAISFLYGFHHLLWLHEIGWRMQKDTVFIAIPAHGWDVNYYISQIKEVMEGHFFFANVYLAEYKHGDARSSLWWLRMPVYLAALCGKMLHVEVQYLVVSMDFTLPPLLFLCAYGFLYWVSQVRSMAIAGALLLTLTPQITRFDIFAALLARFASLQGFMPPFLAEAHSYNVFCRTISPQLNYIFFVATLYCFFKGGAVRKNAYFAAATLFGVLTSYAYPFFGTHLYVFLGMGGILAYMANDPWFGRRYFSVLAVILVCSLPYWYSNFSISRLSEMSWMNNDHTPIINAQIVVTALVCVALAVLLFKGALSKPGGSVALALLLSGIVCQNQHVLTGAAVQIGHYMLYVIPQATILALALLVAEWHKHAAASRGANRRWQLPALPLDTLAISTGIVLAAGSWLLRPACVAAYLSPDGILSPNVRFLLELFHRYGFFGGGALFLGGLVLRRRPAATRWSIRLGTMAYLFVIGYVPIDLTLVSYERYQRFIKPNFSYLQQIRPALRWLNTTPQPEAVILGDFDYVYTDNFITVYTPHDVYFSSGAQWFALPTLAELHDRLYNLLYFMGIRTQAEFETLTAERSLFGLSFETYRMKFKQEVYSALKTYRVDYIFYGPREQKSFKVVPEMTYPFLKKAYDDGVVKIYQVL